MHQKPNIRKVYKKQLILSTIKWKEINAKCKGNIITIEKLLLDLNLK